MGLRKAPKPEFRKPKAALSAYQLEFSFCCFIHSLFYLVGYDCHSWFYSSKHLEDLTDSLSFPVPNSLRGK